MSAVSEFLTFRVPELKQCPREERNLVFRTAYKQASRSALARASLLIACAMAGLGGAIGGMLHQGALTAGTYAALLGAPFAYFYLCLMNHLVRKRLRPEASREPLQPRADNVTE